MRNYQINMNDFDNYHVTAVITLPTHNCQQNNLSMSDRINVVNYFYIYIINYLLYVIGNPNGADE